MRKLLSLAVATAFAALVGTAHAATFTPGTADIPSPPGNAFPRWFTDQNGLSLAPCLSQTQIGTGGPLCVLLADPGFVPTDPVEFPGNFPSETFYAIADALVDLTVDGKNSAKYRAALEGAFTNGVVQQGQQMAFVRVRYVIDAPVAGNYRITHPFGQKVFLNVPQDAAAIKVQDDIGGVGVLSVIDTATGAPGGEAMQAFLRRAAGNIVVGNEIFIGDPNVDQQVIGATHVVGGQPFNAFRVEIDADKDGNYEQSFTTNNFQVAGKMIGLTITPPVAGTDFGAWQLATPAPAKTFTVTNISASILNMDVNSITSSDPQFAVTSNCAQVPAGGTCTFDVVFTPTANGAQKADITVSAGGVVPPAVVAVTSTGDSIPPTITISAPATGGFTNDTTPLLTYSVSDGTVVVSVDGVIINKVSGNSLDTLGDGVHTVRVESTDTAGNIGFAVSEFTVDTVPPTATIAGTPANPTNSRSASLTVAGDQVAFYQYKLNNGALTAFFPVAQNINLSSLNQGTNTVTVFGRDAAGNVQQGQGTPVSWVVDTTPPALVITNPTLLTKVNTLTLEGTVEAGIVPVVTVAAPASAGVVTESNGTWSCVISNLQEGQNNLTITATDAATNVSTRTPIITLDTIPPTYNFNDKPASLTNTKTATLTVAGAGVATYLVKVDNGAYGNSDIPVATAISLSDLADGVHTVTVKAKDLAGNEGIEVSTSWTVDTTPPALTLTPPPVSTSNNFITISGTVEAGANVVVTGASTQLTDTTWSASLTNLTVGVNNVTVTATDAAGNSSSKSVAIVAGSFAVTATAGTGGSISPAGVSAALVGSAKTLTFTPDAHYHVSDVIVDGVSRGPLTSIRLGNIQKDRTVQVVFSLDTLPIKVTASAGGTVTPEDGSKKVEYDHDKKFNITPKAGFHIVDVLVNGASVGAVSSYTFLNVKTAPVGGLKISAKFSSTWTITLRKTGKGTVLGGVIAKVKEGASKTYTIKPAAGQQIADVTLDGESIKNTMVGNKLTITNVTAHHDLNVTFTPVQ